MVALSFIDIAIVVTYMATCLAVGFYKSSKIKNIREYAVGDRNFSTLVMVSTLFATYVGAGRIGEVNAIYSHGLVFGLPLLLLPVNWFLAKHIYAKNIWRFEGCISMSEIMEKLYGPIGRNITNIAAILTGIGILTIQAVAIGLLLQYFFSIDYFKAVIVGMIIITIYSSLGGIRAVALTDVFQFLVFFVALPIACGYSFYQVGSFDNIINALPSSHLTLFDSDDSIIKFLGFVFWMLIPVISGPYVQRLLMSRDKRQLNNSYKIVILLSILLFSLLFFTSFLIKATFPNIEAKFAFYHYIANLPPILVGLMIAGMLAIIMSSADSWLNTLSIVIVNDVFKKQLLSLSDKQRLYIAKITTCCCAFLAIMMANMNEQEIMKLDLLAVLFAFPLYFIPMTVGFLGFKSNFFSYIGSVVLGFAGILINKYQFNEFGAVAMIYSMIGNIIGLFGAHYWQFPHELNDLRRKLVGKISDIIKSIIATPGEIVYKLKHFNITSNSNNNGKNSYFLGFTFCFVLLNVPIFMFGIGGISNESMILRVIASVLCIIMCLSEMCLNNKNREILSYISITFCLPFLGIYSYLASGYELIWLVNTIVSVVLFFVLVSRGNAILFGLIGVLLGYGLQSHNTDIMVSNNMMLGQYSSFMLSVLLLGTLYYINLQSKKEKESLKTLGQSIAHDMGVPLSMGIMSTDLLSKALADKDYELAGKYVQEMHTYSKTAMQDVRVMLSSMSTDMSKKPSDWGDYSLSEIVQDAVCNYHLSEQQRSRITVAVETDYKFEGSAVLLRHVLHNLLANAFKYAGEQANISIFVDNVPRTMHGEGYTTLHIKDDGYGIAVDIKEKMFERHVSSGGHGIGLNFCREAMRLMNGDIKCISEKGKGTEFVLSFNN